MKIPKNISKNAQLIKGVGASSWFTIAKERQYYRIERYALDGELECSGLFKPELHSFDINSKYKFTYISHCQICTIIQNDITYKFYSYEN
tara:strand:- start:1249 stop:1518 length:270 start_codon:yes stop_codon:yes gene_type:complete